MKFSRDEMGLHFTIGKRLEVYFINEWRQILRRCNWYDFTLIQLHFEYDAMSQMFEANVMLLGLGCEIRIDRDYEHSKVKSLADEAWEEIEASRKGIQGD